MAQQSGMLDEQGILRMIQGLEARAHDFAAVRRPCHCGSALAGRDGNDVDQELTGELDALEKKVREFVAGRRPCYCGGDIRSDPVDGIGNDNLGGTDGLPGDESRDGSDSDSDDHSEVSIPLRNPSPISLGPSPVGSPLDSPGGASGDGPESDTGGDLDDDHPSDGSGPDVRPGQEQPVDIPGLPPSPNYMQPEEDYYMLSATSDEDEGDILRNEAVFRDLMDIDPTYQQALGEAAAGRRSKAAMKKEGRYCKYIPEWTNPDVAARGTRPYPYRRPALLPEDRVEGLESDDPSQYAMRFGKDPSAPWIALGRSMLTPVKRSFAAAGQEGPDASVPDWLEDWQSFVFAGYTAAELKQQGAFDPDMIFQEPSLDMSEDEIHPLLWRGNWAQQDRKGLSSSFPVLLYNLDGTDRRWNVQQRDNVLWNALQPSLKLASKILFSDPPFWRSILNLYKLGPVASSRIPKEARTEEDPGWDTLTAVHLEIEDRDMYPEAVALRDLGFEATAIAEHVLKTYVCFCFGEPKDEETAVTQLFRMEQPELDGRQFKIEVKITPQVVWPLLVPEYSASEKAVTSVLIASLLLHELAHAVVLTHEIMIGYPGWNTAAALRPFHIDLEHIPEEQLSLLTVLGDKLGGRLREPMYFFQNELQAEEGYAFEKQLWGGKLDSLMCDDTGFTPHDGFPQIIASLREWPNSKRQPRPYYMSPTATDEENEGVWPAWLTDPLPTMVNRDTALPVTMLSRYLDHNFWSAQFRQYGQQALKLPRHRWEDKPLKSRPAYRLSTKRALQGAFGSKTAFKWIQNARKTLFAAREYAVATYLMALSRSVVEPAMMRRRLHYEKKTWPLTDAELTRLSREVTHNRDMTATRLEEYRAERRATPLDAAEVGRCLERYLAEARQLFIQATDLNRLLGEEIYYLQFLVLGYLRQDDDTRTRLQSYMDTIFERIDRVLSPAADNITRATMIVNAKWLDEMTENEKECVAQNVPVDPAVRKAWDTISTMSSDATAAFPATRQLLSDLRDIVQNGQRIVARRLAEPPLSGNFNLLADSVGLREIRTRRRWLHNLALRDMRRLSHNANLRALIEEWLAVLATHDKLRGDATEEQRRALRRDVPADSPQPPAGVSEETDLDYDDE